MRLKKKKFLGKINHLIEEYSEKKEEKFLILEEFIDHGVLQNRNPEYLFEINEFSKEKAEKDSLDESLEIVRVGINVKFFTNLSDGARSKLFVEMSGQEIVERLKSIRSMIISGYIQPPGTLFYDKEHFKLRIDGVKIDNI